MIRAVRDFLVMNAGPEQVGLPGAGWRVGLVTNGSFILLALHARYSAKAEMIDSSR